MSPTLRNLIPRRAKSNASSPLATIRQLTWVQWAQVLSASLAVIGDTIDSFSVSLSLGFLNDAFGKTTTELTTAITLTFLLRSFGAFASGLVSDRYGRKWPLVFNLVVCSALQLGSGFCRNFSQFLALRSLFGIAMGGVWGPSTTTALESVPPSARGFVSAWIQQGFPIGCLIAAAANLRLLHTPHTWRALFWFGAALNFATAVFRACLPESPVFVKARAARESNQDISGHQAAPGGVRVLINEIGQMFKVYWSRCIYGILLTTALSFLGHGFGDLYPVFLLQNKLLSADDTNLIVIIAQCGCCAGGVIAGYASQYIGRRLTIIVSVCVAAAFVPLWILPSDFSGLAAGAFCASFGLQGAWAVIPIFLTEISPPAFRAMFPGLMYQLGGLAPSASAQIEAAGAERWQTVVRGQIVPDYSKVQGVFVGVAAACTVLVACFGFENHGSEFDTCFEQDVSDAAQERYNEEGVDEKVSTEELNVTNTPRHELKSVGNV